MSWYDGYQVWLSEEQSLHNGQLVVDHFKGTDWSDKSLAALLGNMRHESSINPDMYEFGYDWEDDRGYGLVQWTPRSKYWDWAESENLPPREGPSQLARIDYEVENNIQWIPIEMFNYMTFTEFRLNAGNWSIDYLTDAFVRCYERPADPGASLQARQDFAHLAFDTLDFSGHTEPEDPPAFDMVAWRIMMSRRYIPNRRR